MYCVVNPFHSCNVLIIWECEIFNFRNNLKEIRAGTPKAGPAPVWRGLPRSLRARQVPPRTLHGPPSWAVEHIAPGRLSIRSVLALQQPECNHWIPFMESAPLWGLVSIGDPYGP